MKHSFCLLLATAAVGCSLDSPPKPAAGDSAPSLTSEPVVAALAPAAEVTEQATEFVIDVRSREEWDSGHVAQAVHIPHAEIADRIAEVTDDKTATIVLYCAVGGHHGKAKATLQELGFTNVENGGGFDDVKTRYE